MTKYYVVARGHQTGIFTKWSDVQPLIKGFSRALYKSFTSKVEAEHFLANNSDDKPIYEWQAWTDGSYSKKRSGFGVILFNKDNKFEAYGKVPLPPTNNVAELYAIYVALSLNLYQPMSIFTDSNYSIDALTSYYNNNLKKNFTGVANADIIQATHRLMESRTVNFHHIRSHQGIELNERADYLANLGRDQSESLVVNKI